MLGAISKPQKSVKITEVILSVRCPRCLGRGKIGSPASIPCDQCGEAGTVPRAAEELTPEQATHLREALKQAPRDLEAEYDHASTLDHITRLLTGFMPAAVAISEDQRGSIDITDASGLTLRIHPVMGAGILRLSVLPLPT